MSYENGLKALKLEMSDYVPRTEYSAHEHWPLVEKVTGMKVNEFCTPDIKQQASSAFLREWDYGMFWNVYLMHQGYGDYFTSMGHAVYAAGGVDYDNKVFCPF